MYRSLFVLLLYLLSLWSFLPSPPSLPPPRSQCWLLFYDCRPLETPLLSRLLGPRVLQHWLGEGRGGEQWGWLKNRRHCWQSEGSISQTGLVAAGNLWKVAKMVQKVSKRALKQPKSVENDWKGLKMVRHSPEWVNGSSGKQVKLQRLERDKISVILVLFQRLLENAVSIFQLFLIFSECFGKYSLKNPVIRCLPMQDCAKRPIKASRFHFWNAYSAKRSPSHAKMTFFSVVLSKSRTVHTRCTLGEMMIFNGAHTVHKGITKIIEL